MIERKASREILFQARSVSVKQEDDLYIVAVAGRHGAELYKFNLEKAQVSSLVTSLIRPSYRLSFLLTKIGVFVIVHLQIHYRSWQWLQWTDKFVFRTIHLG